MPQFSGTRDLRGYLRILWRWKFLLIAFLIAAPLAAYLAERGKAERLPVERSGGSQC